jgi:hypothetical protein
MGNVAIAKLTPRILDIPMVQGDDLILAINFTTDISGYTDFKAVAKDVKTGTVYDFTIDDSAQGSNRLILLLTAAQTADFTEAKWDFSGVDPDGKIKTYAKGTILTEEGYANASRT